MLTGGKAISHRGCGPSTGSGQREMFLGSTAADFALLNVWVVGYVGERWEKGSWYVKLTSYWIFGVDFIAMAAGVHDIVSCVVKKG